MKNMKLFLLCLGLFVMVSTSAFGFVTKGTYTGRNSYGNYIETINILTIREYGVGDVKSRGKFSYSDGSGTYLEGTYLSYSDSIKFEFDDGTILIANRQGRSFVYADVTYSK